MCVGWTNSEYSEMLFTSIIYKKLQLCERFISKNFKIVALTENRKINKKINGIRLSQNSEDILKKTDLIIDFTIPKCTFQILKIASKLKKRVIIGTTGFTKKEENLMVLSVF